MNLNILWFVLIAILYCGFFFLEGFDFGVGMLLPVVGKKDVERRAVINTIGPHWDGNEVWLIVAGGATFAAFPNWYATLFSGFYMGMFLLLLALIFRGVSFEFRSKVGHPKWRKGWDTIIAASSFLASFLLGVVFTNLVMGVPIDGNQVYTGTFFTLLNPAGILGGVALVALFLFHGANFLGLKLTVDLKERADKFSGSFWVVTLILVSAWLVMLILTRDIFMAKGFAGVVLPVLAVAALVLSKVFKGSDRDGLSFIASSLTVVAVIGGMFTALYPNVMISSTSAQFNLTIYNAASSAYTLGVMSIVAAIMVPVILAYQAWTYWVFRKRVRADEQTLTY
jgi:cytochrome d ubiquinol oxidase subunit II